MPTYLHLHTHMQDTSLIPRRPLISFQTLALYCKRLQAGEALGVRLDGRQGYTHTHLFLHEVFLPCLLLNVQLLLQVSELSRVSPADLIQHPATMEHKLNSPSPLHPGFASCPHFSVTEEMGRLRRRLRRRLGRRPQGTPLM